MALKVELKPRERIIIGQVVIRNDEQRTRFFIEGDAPILREKDILTGASADTPAKKIYLAIQLMYLAQDRDPGLPDLLRARAGFRRRRAQRSAACSRDQ